MSRHIVSNPQPYIQNCSPPYTAQAGQVWFDTAKQGLVVYDGTYWQDVSKGINDFELTYQASEAIDYVINLMKENDEITKLIQKYPMVREAFEEFETVLKLHQNLGDEDDQAQSGG